MLVRIIPKSQRAKNRIREHGEIMRLTSKRPDTFLVYSISDTWHAPDGTMKQWAGWFSYEDATFEPFETK